MLQQLGGSRRRRGQKGPDFDLRSQLRL